MSLFSTSLLFCSISFAQELPDSSPNVDSMEGDEPTKENVLEQESIITNPISESFEGTVVLLNGDKLTGMIYVYSDESIVIHLDSFGEVELSKDVIKDLIPQLG